MKKLFLGMMCLLMLFTISGCSSNNNEVETLKKENETLKTLNEKLSKTKVDILISGSFTVTVNKLLPCYELGEKENSVAVVSFFQSDEFLLHVGKNVASQLKEKGTYTFDVDKSSVIEDYSYEAFQNKNFDFEMMLSRNQIKYQLVGIAKEGEIGIESNRMTVKEKVS